jgi:hypothetical protein
MRRGSTVGLSGHWRQAFAVIETLVRWKHNNAFLVIVKMGSHRRTQIVKATEFMALERGLTA